MGITGGDTSGMVVGMDYGRGGRVKGGGGNGVTPGIVKGASSSSIAFSSASPSSSLGTRISSY